MRAQYDQSDGITEHASTLSVGSAQSGQPSVGSAQSGHASVVKGAGKVSREVAAAAPAVGGPQLPFYLGASIWLLSGR